MSRFSKILRLAGIVMTIAGILGVALTYADMRHQRHLHDRLVGVKLRLSTTSDWQAGEFSPRESGSCSIYLSHRTEARTSSFQNDSDGRRLPSNTSGQVEVHYSGTFELRITDDSGDILWSKRVSDTTFVPELVENTSWVLLDSVHLRNERERSLKLEVRVDRPQTDLQNTISEVIVMPPESQEIGSVILGSSLRLIGYGVLTVVGFCTLLLGGYVGQRRSSRTV